MIPRRRGALLAGRADLHFHPLPDEQAAYEPELLLDLLREADLDVVAITEHDRVDLAFDLVQRAAAAGLRTQLIAGCEVTSADGHILALFVERAPKPGRGVLETVAEIHRLGGLAIAAHPLLPTCLSLRSLRASLGSADPLERLDALEDANPAAASVPLQPKLVQRIARHYGVPVVGGSDGHAEGLGKALTHFAGTDVDELRQSLDSKLTTTSYRRASRSEFLLYGPRYLLAALRRRAAALRTSTP